MAPLVWLITGCTSGFGSLMVQQILSRGDKVIATGRTLSKLSSLQESGAAVLQLDVTDSQQSLNATIVKAIAIYGRIDVLVNNAAYIQTGAWEDLEYGEWLAEFDANVLGVIKVTRAVLPHLRERKAGTIVFLSSRSGWYGDAFCSAYSGSKFALEGIVEGLRWETEQFGIKTLMIEPGRFRTKFLSPGNLRTKQSHIPDYEEASRNFIAYLAQNEDGKQPGDPLKAVEIILDLVRKEGVAEGKEVPFRLPLGRDCYETIKEKCEETLKLLKEWEGVCTSTDLPRKE
ncbi:NAD(P)-binding protein [Lindgomyces ingoldianus]|uniref:NAD(P)-binding protein n=1 Tax=Lindgomyces ingoldianus TaxID=673940 RepID=A0ACB6R777_9PLEO|nr:NAD(P)-binding protein [Lindgomyces ingoldianus]KAF2475123.1 NAD(P)-binding protein [Lindgomyces ingoldianus]